MIELPEIALKFSSIDAITSTLSDSQLTFTAKQLLKKYPELTSLGNTPLITLKKNVDGSIKQLIPTIYNDHDELVICLPDLNRSVSNLFKIESWQIGDVSNCTLQTNDGIILKGAIACTRDILDDVRTEYDGQLEGEGTDTLKSLWIKKKPEIELPLRTLPVGMSFEVISTGTRSRKYSTLMVNLKDPSGNEYHNVITNSALRNLMDSGCKEFMIKEILPLKKDKTRSDKVIITPLDGADFSDLLTA